MHNFYASEVEAEFRRQEAQQRAAADLRSAQAVVDRGFGLSLSLPRLSLGALRAQFAPRLASAGLSNPPCAALPAEC